MSLSIPELMLAIMHTLVAIGVLIEFPRSVRKIWGKITSMTSKAIPAASNAAADQPTKSEPTKKPKWRKIFDFWFAPAMFWLLIVEVFMSGAMAVSDPVGGIVFFVGSIIGLMVVQVYGD